MVQSLRLKYQCHTGLELGNWKQMATMDSNDTLYMEHTIALDDSWVKDLPQWVIDFAMPVTR